MGLVGGRVEVDGDGAEAWGAAGARDGPMAGSKDRRFPRAGMKNRLYIKGD
jgi:hypothetical protein